ncbi:MULTISPECIES: hypothetical protein [Rhizobium/Agrobacterium group]|uniref:Uncharacterized protein n=2 Tax=Neorhizobium TaxID=1525371 RepID=A0ABV0LVD3_9HYPH|nr:MULTISPECIES: hypothetical protein [Rhizobium/Agrobacterium group]MCC2608656.1 hypothetical protein [Neorhizobium petrolearium]WGI68916.1 hypothetical protein QEO92_02140 [Neorhizobium petrolearium]
MSRIAAVFMFFAWLLYGAMPAMATSSVLVSGKQPPPIVHDHSQHRGHGQHEHGRTIETSQTAHMHGDTKQPCPHGAKACAAPFCAVCVTLLPNVATGDAGRIIHAYPAPAVEQALVSPVPAPLTPPPRA